MRQFKLLNAANAEWNLNSVTSFFHDIGGLGFAQNIVTTRAGYSFLKRKVELAQATATGKISFHGYAIYQQFIAFCEVGGLVLAYMPFSEWYYANVEIQSIEKTELVSKKLICPISFLLLETWRKSNLISQVITDDSDAKKYDYTYDYIYRDATVGTALISNTGLVSPCKINIFGPVINPHWSLFQDSVKIADGEVTAVIPAGYKLVINSDPAQMEIAEYSIDNVFSRDLYGLSDFSTPRFIYVPSGDSSMSFSHDGATVIDATVEVMQLAKSV